MVGIQTTYLVDVGRFPISNASEKFIVVLDPREISVENGDIGLRVYNGQSFMYPSEKRVHKAFAMRCRTRINTAMKKLFKLLGYSHEHEMFYVENLENGQKLSIPMEEMIDILEKASKYID